MRRQERVAVLVPKDGLVDGFSPALVVAAATIAARAAAALVIPRRRSSAAPAAVEPVPQPA